MRTRAASPFKATASGAPIRLARIPIHTVPKGPVPMHADRMPMARPRMWGCAPRSTIALCMVAKPDSARPIANSRPTDSPNHGEAVNPRSSSAASIEPPANT